jgi:3-isopropylmalate/(R)-2-methylmalate dehydratase large subunit
MTIPETVRLTGRILQLTEDSALLARQLGGEDLPWDPERPLVDNISTDELTPGWVCYYYDETLAEYCLVGCAAASCSATTSRAGASR